jgi:hypothetical protein
MPYNEQGYPIIPHESITGHSFVQVRGNEADITCNECGDVIRTVPAQEVGAVTDSLMMQVAAGAIYRSLSALRRAEHLSRIARY